MRVKSLEAFYIQLSQISTCRNKKFCDSAIWHFCTYLLNTSLQRIL